MKRILVPTDFSECADRAIDFAAHLARKTSGEIYLLHVLENDESYPAFSTSGEWSSIAATTEAGVPYMINLLKETKVMMNDIMQRPSLEGLTVYDNIEIGTPAVHINESAEKYKADIIIMGTHGAGGLKELFVGSNAEKVVQGAKCPVLSIKKYYTSEPKLILFASDFNDEADPVFESVKKFADIFGAGLHLLKVIVPEKFESEPESKNVITAFLKRHNVTQLPYTIYNDHVEEGGIRHFAKEIKADIIALGSHGRHGLALFFNGSISEELVNHSYRPVLTIKFP